MGLSREAFQAAEQIEQGGFAGAGRPHDGEQLALSDVESDAVERLEAAVAHRVGLGDVQEVVDGVVGGVHRLLFRGEGVVGGLHRLPAGGAPSRFINGTAVPDNC
jgi:hypothetical protein